MPSPDLGVPEAVHEVVVDHPRGLHQGVADRRADEREPRRFRSLLIASDSPVRAGTSWRDPPCVPDRAAPDESPDEGVEAAELPLDLEERPGILDGRGDLEPVADDPGVGEQRLDLPSSYRATAAGSKRSKASRYPPASSGWCPN